MRSGSPVPAPDAASFREVLPGPTWLRVAGVLVVVAAILLAGDALVVEPQNYRGAGLIAAVIAMVLMLLLGILLLVVRTTVTVTPSTLTIALFPVLRRSFPRASVTAARSVAVTVREFGGVGYRTLPGGRRGLLLSAGSALEFRAAGLVYTVRADRAADLIAALRRA